MRFDGMTIDDYKNEILRELRMGHPDREWICAQLGIERVTGPGAGWRLA